ncbi:hypothetical protein NA57DRAFT_55739 [Rhizodiscina lignyota]|uniref:Peptidase S33 tripeptidyl aminopeptidase-like C-terminal domain-containing protein n=1 Tax=Rhizodiscina lignyota TaxID=1504668 RepID=A0A9P4IGX0_9PEZI|nr:hypothetical protein NA57DRAFT_55739 [Rhizodiscina lignyota]
MCRNQSNCLIGLVSRGAEHSIETTQNPVNSAISSSAAVPVPLDYQNHRLGRASVPLIKVAAHSNSSDGPYQGIVPLNPGGPGGSGISEAVENGSTIQAVLGTNWDVVGFDPRGMWLSEPVANCSANTVPHQNITFRPRSVPRVTDEYFNSYIEFSKELERVGNVVLDGGVSTEGYLADATSAAVYHLDGIIAAFFIYCHEAGPSNCSYYTGSTPKGIYERFNRSFVQLDPRKAEAENWSNATDLESALLTLKVALLSAADALLSFFGLLPELFLGLETAVASQDIRPWTEQVQKILAVGDPGPISWQNPEWNLGVLCSDQGNKWYNKTLQDWRPPLKELEDESIIGEVWSRSALGCSGWSIKSNDIFTGPFGGDTATPILFVSNTYDPVTPIENSFSSAPNYKDAQVPTVDGMGHTSSSSYNLCGFAKVRAYFQTNQLPGNDSFCPLEAGPFNIILNGTLKASIERAGLSDLVH